MRIVINNIAASSGGALSILRSFYEYLVKSGESKEHEWIFLLSDRYIEETDNIKVITLDTVKKNWLARLKFDLYSGKNFISKLNPDVVFSLQNTITFGMKCPQVLYMHQAIPFQNVKSFSLLKTEERTLAVYQHLIGKLIKKSIKEADKTIVQTQWIKEAVIKATKIDSNKIVNIFPPKEDYLKYKRNDTEFKRKNFFYPAANSLYKNHQCIYDACAELNGKGISEYNVSLTIKDREDVGNISFIGDIPFELVMEKYNTSTLIFPSYIETVGLPLVEARQIGTIVLAADCPFSREVLDGYSNAYFFEPFKPQQLAKLMEKVINGQISRVEADESRKVSNNGWAHTIKIIKGISGEKYEDIMAN
ncbi:glycosyltransferase [Bacillus cereus]|nr:glycosyltransferase [Bacillus cereus]PGU60101.1 glycosyltransferase [Bacillus cereus]